MIKIAIVISNMGSTDPRVIKLYPSLSKKYSVLILGWDRTGGHPTYENLTNNVVVRRLRLKMPYGRIYTRTIPTLIFFFWVFINLCRFMPRIVHACNLDGIIPCYIYKIYAKNMVIFDLFDRLYLSITKCARTQIVISLLRVFEEFFSRRADALVTNSMKLRRTFISKPKNCAIIMNCPDDYRKTENTSRSTGQCFKLVFAGYVTPERGLELVAKAISKLKNVKLMIAGDTRDYEYLKRLLEHWNVEYLGFLPYEEAMSLQESADAIVIPYDPQLPMNRIGAPNKLFDAMMLGVPTITTICKEIVEESGCGLYVDFEVVSVRDAIVCLKSNPSLREELGSNGRIAFEHKYNWSLMETRLFDLYDILLMGNRP